MNLFVLQAVSPCLRSLHPFVFKTKFKKRFQSNDYWAEDKNSQTASLGLCPFTPDGGKMYLHILT